MLLLGYPNSIGFAETCDEKVSIANTTYSIGDLWCGKRLDKSRLADPKALVRLPDRFSYQDLGIYLDKEARDAFVRMAEAASQENIVMHVKSGYRSARYQKEIITRRLDAGKSFEEITRYIAPPGYSEHETGRAIDLVSDVEPFRDSDAYAWLEKNGGKYGFEESYPRENNTSTPWEPWHWYYKDSPQ